MESRPIKVILVGFGNSARRFHLPQLGPITGTVLAGVVVRSAESRRDVAQVDPSIPVSNTISSLLTHVPDADLVVIATPVESHSQLASEALAAGKHVLVEKPFARTTAEAQSVLNEASSYDRILTCYMNRRFDGDYLTARCLLAAGGMGTPIRLFSSWERPGANGDLAVWCSPTSRQGGLLGTGSHLIDQALQLLGPANRVTARRRSIGWRDGDTLSGITLEHDGGAISELIITSSAQRFRRRLEILGTKGQLDLACTDDRDLAFDASEAVLHSAGQREPVSALRAAWHDLYRGTVAAVRGSSPPPVSPDEIIMLQATLDACFESATSGRSVVPAVV